MTAKRRQWLIGAGAMVMLAFAALNAVAYRHALMMTRYGDPGLVRTGKPDELGWAQKAIILVIGVAVPRPVARTTPKEAGLDFQTLRLQAADGTGLEAWHIPLAKSRGIAVLLHGYATEKSAMLREAAALRELGYAALLLDFRGSGGSDGSETTVGWTEAEDVRAAITEARRLAPGKTVLVYAKSMGAASALRAVGVLGAAPDALVLEAPFDTLLRTTGRRFKMMRLPPWPFTELLLFWGGRRAGFDPRAHEPMAYARGVRCPTLLLHGAQDKYVTVEDAERIHGNVPNARLAVFQDGAHGEFSRSVPNEWRRELADFLGSL